VASILFTRILDFLAFSVLISLNLDGEKARSEDS
jgi:hypothetical protein